jgi:hypothetical protein
MLIETALALDPVIFARETLDFTPDEQQAKALRSTSKRILYNAENSSQKMIL